MWLECVRVCSGTVGIGEQRAWLPNGYAGKGLQRRNAGRCCGRVVPMPRCQSLHVCPAAQVMQQLDTAEAQAAAGEAAGAELSLVVDGRALGVLLAEAAVKRRLLALGTRCAAVVCCRVSPLQKALVTRLVRAFVQGLGLMRAN